jgi:hypothetical protein
MLTAAGLLAALAAGNDRTLAQTQPQPSGAVATTTRFVAIGCLGRATANTEQFTITDTRGDKPVSYRLEGDPKDLDWHVGHTLEILGRLAPAAPGDGAASAATPILKVEQVIYISSSCATAK